MFKIFANMSLFWGLF